MGGQPLHNIYLRCLQLVSFILEARAVLSGVHDPTFCHWITFFSITQAQGHPFAQCYARPPIFVPSAIPWSILLGVQSQTKAVKLLFDTSPFKPKVIAPFLGNMKNLYYWQEISVALYCKRTFCFPQSTYCNLPTFLLFLAGLACVLTCSTWIFSHTIS